MGRLSPAERTEGSAESEEVKQSNFRFHIEVIILFALNMYVQDLGLECRKMASFEKYIRTFTCYFFYEISVIQKGVSYEAEKDCNCCNCNNDNGYRCNGGSAKKSL